MSEHDEISLQPCPFCGGSATLIEAEPPGGWCIECERCQASSALRYSLKEDARPLLAEQWNRRREIATLTRELAEAREQRDRAWKALRFIYRNGMTVKRPLWVSEILSDAFGPERHDGPQRGFLPADAAAEARAAAIEEAARVARRYADTIREGVQARPELSGHTTSAALDAAEMIEECIRALAAKPAPEEVPSV